MSTITSIRSSLFVVCWLAVTWQFVPVQHGLAGESSLPDLISRTEVSVVRIEVEIAGGASQGSGFATAKGIVTNFHVIEDGKAAEVALVNGTRLKVVGVIAHDAELDLALLKVKSDETLRPLSLARTEPRKGETVLAFGAPRGFSWTASDGIVSGLRTGAEVASEISDYDLGEDVHWVQTTAPISAGNSGGPLVNLAGEVVGVNTWTYSSGQNLNFAISSREVARFLDVANQSNMIAFDEVQGLESRPAHSDASMKHRLFAAYMEPVFEKELEKAARELRTSTEKLQKAYVDERLTLAEVEEIASRVREAKMKLENLGRDGISVPTFLEGKNAGIGKPGRWYVFQVIAEDALLVKPSEQSDQIVCVEGLPTAGIADDMYRDFDGLWFTLGETYSYQTLIGGSKTVYKIRAIDAQPRTIEQKFWLEVVVPRVDEVLAEIGNATPPTPEEAQEIEQRRSAWQVQEAEHRRRSASNKLAEPLLGLAKRNLQTNPERARKFLMKIIDKYPDSDGAAEAKELLGDPAIVEFRTWTSGKFKTQAKLIGISNGNVTLENGDGKKITVPLTRLSKADQAYAERMKAILQEISTP
ncbi:MAG: trypsin-like peptidase domain-containing protein [Planctomycetales bacterium]|nr:trypsin-like peptidase domain-containing protein [Planctomycetales bacterium]